MSLSIAMRISTGSMSSCAKQEQARDSFNNNYFKGTIMSEYIFYTTEGFTQDPNENNIENCQVLGRAFGKNAKEARCNLLKENPWIEEAGFDTTDLIVKQLLTEEQKADIKAVVDYLWKDEHKHFQEEHYPKNHIYRILKRLKSSCG